MTLRVNAPSARLKSSGPECCRHRRDAGRTQGAGDGYDRRRGSLVCNAPDRHHRQRVWSRLRWLDAASHCNMIDSWLFRRNAINRGLFRNAAWAVEQKDYDPEVLWLPVGTTRPDLHLGDADPPDGTTYVADAQFILDWLGYSTAQSAKGTFDQEMLSQVQAFQQREGFPVTGTVGPLTWAALGYQVPHN